MSYNAVQEKSYAFALRVIEVYRFLIEERKEFVLARQLLRSGTSIGANVEEALGGQTERDFFAKMNIAYKEARETHYWLRLLRDSRMISEDIASSLLADCDELLKLSGTILKTLKQKRNAM
jgi:four helix bundle protein